MKKIIIGLVILIFGLVLFVGCGVVTPDTTAPVITLLGENSVNLNVGDDYVDAGATAFDNVDGDITANIIIVNPVDTSIAGTYIVTYNASDSAGNAADEATRTVNVGVSVEKFLGYWVNEDENTSGITKVDITQTGNNIIVYMWGKCHPTDCDWAEMVGGPATTSISDANDGILNITWNFGFVIETQELTVLSDGRLAVTASSTYSAGFTTTHIYYFQKQI